MLGTTGILAPRNLSSDKANEIERRILAGCDAHQMRNLVQQSRIAQEHRQLVSMLSSMDNGDLHPASINIEEISRLRSVIIEWIHEMENRYHVLNDRRSNLYRFARTLRSRD
jgi:hypothetical protein